MLKFEWPLLLPNDENIKKLSTNVMDIDEYIVDIANKEGVAEGLQEIDGGCSTMGTLSGGNNVKISIGENCLLGANSGLGIPLGDNCIIEAGLYVTGGSKITTYNSNNKPEAVVKASELAGQDNLLFIRNSQNGAIEARINPKSIALNKILHKN